MFCFSPSPMNTLSLSLPPAFRLLRLRLSTRKIHSFTHPQIVTNSDRRMASPLVPEWSGIYEFSAATQTKFFELLEKLKTKDVSSLTILVMGKSGVGKSSTVNSLIGERVVAVSAFQSEVLKPVKVSRSWNELTLNVIDTPGFIEGGSVNIAIDSIKRFLSQKTIDVLLYVDRLDTYRVNGLDKQVVRAITDSFGKNIWRRSLVVLTHAQLSPPDGLNYDAFHLKRSELLLEDIRSGAKFSRKEFLESPIPVVLAENSSRCNTNDSGEKILPNGTSWIPNLVKRITDVISNESKAITVAKRSNPNNEDKFMIPFILVLQFFCIMRPMGRLIKYDIKNRHVPLWEQRDLGWANGEY